jgi:hypothetical protein
MLLALSGFIPAVAPDMFPVKVKVEDASGASVKDELVIIQDLNNREREVIRTLSEQDGSVPPFQLQPGLYRAIATAPYGVWQTYVHEFLVGQKSTKVIIKVQPLPTHGYGDIVSAGGTRCQLRVIGSDGLPASGASILVRDRDATLHLERWYKTDKNGTAPIELVSDPTVVVVVYGDNLLTKELSQHILNPIIRLQKR